jgi:enoyl-CoA hydratase/carnithine racemase
MSRGIDYAVDHGGIALLRVNRPAARNALTWGAQEAFAEAVSAAAGDAAIRALIITGAGAAFVSGGDLKELSRHPEREAGERLNRVMSAALTDLAALPYPVIAAVNGDAIGGGCEILTACDLRLAAAGARFAFRQVQNGLTTGWGGAARLVRLLGQSRAMDLILTGRVIDATEALSIGLIHRLVLSDEDALDAAYAWASDLIQLPRSALAANKALIHAVPHLSIAEANHLEARLFVDLWPSADHLEAMEALAARRTPIFNHDPLSRSDDHV